MRRPLRFLAYKLDLDERQTEQLAAILDDLKTERAQAAVDHRRMTSAVADLFSAAAFDAAKVAEAGATRVASATRLAQAQAAALKSIRAERPRAPLRAAITIRAMHPRLEEITAVTGL